MACGKKKEKILTPEEKIQKALVSESEWPYKVPENWKWIHLEALKIEPDGFFDGDWILSENMDSEGEVRLLQLSDIGIGEFLDKSDKHISENSFLQLGCTPLVEGDVMISRMAEPIARSCIVPSFPYTVITAVDVAVLRCNPSIVLNYYLNYLCNAKWFTDLAFSMARGTTRVRITRKNLGQMPIPLPPLPEQQRIVDRIESLFAKLDEAKEKAQAVVDGFEDRKAAILHKAFTGKLTSVDNANSVHHLLSEIRMWITKFPKKEITALENEQEKARYLCLPDGREWIKCTIGAIGRVTNGSTPSRKCNDYWNGSIPWVSSGEVRNNIISVTKECITQKGFDNSSVKMLPKGTVLIAMIGEGKTRGQSAILEINATINQNIAAVVIDHGLVEPAFLWFWLQLNYTKNREKGAGSGPQALNCQRVRELEFICPSVSEQQEIVSHIQSMITKEEQAKESAEQVITQIDAMKKSILSRAFRGELGTNDPSDECAEKLLKRIL